MTTIATPVRTIADEMCCELCCGCRCRGLCANPLVPTAKPEQGDTPRPPAPPSAPPAPEAVAVGSAAPSPSPTTATPPAAEAADGQAIVSIVVFTPAALYVGGTAFDFFSGAPRWPVTGTWDQLSTFLATSREGDTVRYPDPDIAKRARGAWVPGMYRGAAGHANLARDLVETKLLVLDVDHGDPCAVAEVLRNYSVIVHSTYKHRPELPRCRVVFQLAASCRSAADYNIALKAVAEMLGARGFTVPAKDSTLGKLAFLPMHQPGIVPIHIVNRGRALDIDRIVAAHRLRQPVVPSAAPTPMPSGSKSPAYVEAAVRRATEAVASASSGERHNQLYKEAASLARPELGLDERTIVDALLPAARHADPDECVAELERTIRDAIKKGRS